MPAVSEERGRCTRARCVLGVPAYLHTKLAIRSNQKQSEAIRSNQKLGILVHKASRRPRDLGRAHVARAAREALVRLHLRACRHSTRRRPQQCKLCATAAPTSAEQGNVRRRRHPQLCKAICGGGANLSYERRCAAVDVKGARRPAHPGEA